MRILWNGRYALLGLFCLGVLISGGCNRSGGAPVEIRLADLFPYTDDGQATARIDAADARSNVFLVNGWSRRAATPDLGMVAWITGRQGEIRFYVAEATPRVATLRLLSRRLRPDRQQVVRVSLNGHELSTLRLQDGDGSYGLTLPAASLHQGENVLQLSSGTRRGNDDGSTLNAGVGLRSLDWHGDGAMVAAPSLKGGTLVIPGGSRAAFFVRVPAQGELGFELGDSERGGRLRVSVQAAGSARRALLIATTAGAVEVSLEAYSDKLAEIVFEALDKPAPMAIAKPIVRGVAAGAGDHGIGGTLKRRANIVLYVVDTLRADHLGCYGYERPTSPRIDAFAKEGLLYTAMRAQASWTKPATASILTGRNPPGHGAVAVRDVLRSDVRSLAEVLKAAGYRTAAFVTNVNVSPAWGFARGFDEYNYLPEDLKDPAVYASAEVINRRAREWLQAQRQRSTSEPFFLYIHVSDAHAPYVPPPPEAERLCGVPAAEAATAAAQALSAAKASGHALDPASLGKLICAYDGEVAYVDRQFGRFIDDLHELGLYGKTAIALVGDHGEEFQEHGGVEHGRTLFEEMLKVPLILRLPDVASAVLGSALLARQIDVLPTLLRYVDVDPPPHLDGRVLAASPTSRSFVEEAYAETRLGRFDLRALTIDTSKLIRTVARDGSRAELYDLHNDPHESAPQSADATLLLGYARQRQREMERQVSGVGEGEVDKPDVDSATLERLRVLGYAD